MADNVSFTLRKGEILGVSGLMGAGRSELFISLFGGYPGEKYGEVIIDGQSAAIKKPSDAIKAGLAYVSEDRKRYGLVMGMEITKNSIARTAMTVICVNRFDKFRDDRNSPPVKIPKINTIRINATIRA